MEHILGHLTEEADGVVELCSWFASFGCKLFLAVSVSLLSLFCSDFSLVVRALSSGWTSCTLVIYTPVVAFLLWARLVLRLLFESLWKQRIASSVGIQDKPQFLAIDWLINAWKKYRLPKQKWKYWGDHVHFTNASKPKDQSNSNRLQFSIWSQLK